MILTTLPFFKHLQPVWQTSPVLKRPFVNQNLFRNNLYRAGSRACLESGELQFGGFDMAPPGSSSHLNPKTSLYASLLSIAAKEDVEYQGDPMSAVFLPVFSSFETARTPVAVLMAIIHWGTYFENILPVGVRGIVAVLSNGCDEPFTYQINEEQVEILGSGDLHDVSFNSHEKVQNFTSHLNIADGTKVCCLLTMLD